MKAKIYKQYFANVQNMGMSLRYDLFLDDRNILCCSFGCDTKDDERMTEEHNRMAVERLLRELKRHINKYLNLEQYAFIPQTKEPLYEFTINEVTIKEWLIEEKMKRIEQDFV